MSGPLGPASTRWRRTTAAWEGLAAAATGRWVSGLVVLAICWTGALVGGVDALDVQRVADGEAAWLAAGGLSFSVVRGQGGGDGGAPLDARACDALTGVPGVRAVVALAHQGEPVTLDGATAEDVPLVLASPGVWGAVGAGSSAVRDVIVPRHLAEPLGLRDGSWITLRPAPGTTTVRVPSHPLRATVADTGPLGEDYDGVVVPTTDAFPASACVITADAGQREGLRLAAPGLVGRAPDARVVDQLARTTFTRDFAAELDGRPLRQSWLPLGLAWGLLWAFTLWIRRSQAALLASLGLDRARHILLRATEWGLLSGTAAVCGLCLGALGAVAAGADVPLATSQVARIVLPAWLVATALALAVPPPRHGRLLEHLKDR